MRRRRQASIPPRNHTKTREALNHLRLWRSQVIKHFLKLASEKAEAAQAQAETLADVEDLEASATPESLMLSYVSVEDDKARADRQLVTPWFKYVASQPPVMSTRVCPYVGHTRVPVVTVVHQRGSRCVSAALHPGTPA